MPQTQQLLRILVVEDDEDDFILINDYIKHLKAWKCEVKWVFRYDDAIEDLCNRDYTICFSDYRLGARNGIDLIKDIAARNCNTPVILLTGKGNYEIDIEATKAGAFDYLIKGELDEDRLERTIRYTLERITNLQKLKDSERKYRNIFEKSKDMVFVADMSTGIITINYAVTDILEISVEESIGRRLTDFFDSKTRSNAFFEKLKKDGEVENFETDLLAVDKSVRTCLINASIEIDSENGSYIQGIIHDITSLKKAELASLQAEKLAATGRFIRTLAHEVRNPLNNINLSVENLVQQIGNEEDRLYLEIIERNAKRINDLITELLHSARPSDMDLKYVSLVQIAREAIDAVQDRVLLRKINLTFHHSGSDALIKADTPKLKMALLNILINAIEAVADELGLIEVSVHFGPGQAMLSISDNGCGMTAETKAKLFEPYFTSKRNGLGLGLATTLTILNAHDAKIEVNSQLDNGTVFQISFAV